MPQITYQEAKARFEIDFLTHAIVNHKSMNEAVAAIGMGRAHFFRLLKTYKIDWRALKAIALLNAECANLRQTVAQIIPIELRPAFKIVPCADRAVFSQYAVNAQYAQYSEFSEFAQFANQEAHPSEFLKFATGMGNR